ncbi:MAG: sodium-translocating pyrophosphatase, partial [Euryarchaeota archaeon]|nr:sodium-translocating pyrophosphatase [Euryarchaeota archaeon]
MVGFIFGASLMSLFARVGGGIYTKGADVGADLVGKVEAGIPEDDPRNPAVIADNVGDNVGDCAGMAADLFETYVVTAVSTMLLAYLFDTTLPSFKITLPNAVIFPLVIGAWAIVATIIGFPFVRLSEGNTKIMSALYKGMFATTGAGIVGLAGLSYWLMGSEWVPVFVASTMGLIVMVVIIFSTDFYTGTYRPVKSIAKAAESGPGPVVIEGMAVGLESTLIPAVSIIAGTLVAFGVMVLANPGPNWAQFGLYGIGLAAASMLSATGMIISIDAFGPITDNAGGIAEMANLPKEAREITDPLDAVGNTTKAVTKGYAVGSAALAALVLFAAYTQAGAALDPSIFSGSALAIYSPQVVVGLIIGATLPFFFTAFLMRAVGTAAQAVVQEVRRQFREIKGIMEGTGKPEYGKCVDLVTKTALHELMPPAVIGVVTPILVGMLLGPVALGGLLIGVILSGLPLAIFMTTGGGAWDNGKKYIELQGRKKTDAHRAAVVGDTVGDATKDTAGPAINPLIKVVNTISILFITVIVQYNLPHLLGY